MFYVQGKFNFFKSGRGGVLSPSLIPGYTPVDPPLELYDMF